MRRPQTPTIPRNGYQTYRIVVEVRYFVQAFSNVACKHPAGEPGIVLLQFAVRRLPSHV